MNYDVIRCESLKILFHNLYLEYRNVLLIIPESILPTIFSYLCYPNRELQIKYEILFHETSTIFAKPTVKIFQTSVRKDSSALIYLIVKTRCQLNLQHVHIQSIGLQIQSKYHNFMVR